MFKNAEEAIAYVKEEGVEFVDIRFCDLPGQMQHFNIPASQFTEDVFNDGAMFDGSSIRGFQAINESDMKLLPDVATAFIDPFRTRKTLVINFSIVDPFTDERYSRDPRNVAWKAQEYLKSTGIGDTAFFAPEAEFFIFDSVRFETNQHEGYYHIDSTEGWWNSGAETEADGSPNRGYKTRYKGGYFPVSPGDQFADLRDEMVAVLEEVGLEVERAHHEVGLASRIAATRATTGTTMPTRPTMSLPLRKAITTYAKWRTRASASTHPEASSASSPRGFTCISIANPITVATRIASIDLRPSADQ